MNGFILGYVVLALTGSDPSNLFSYDLKKDVAPVQFQSKEDCEKASKIFMEKTLADKRVVVAQVMCVDAKEVEKQLNQNKENQGEK